MNIWIFFLEIDFFQNKYQNSSWRCDILEFLAYIVLYILPTKKINSLLCCLQKKEKKRCVTQKIENVYNIRIFQIIWISAISPYIVLSILCVKALTLDGAMDGLKFLFTPDWERLKSSECWIDGGTQIFFSYGVGIGALLALGKLQSL